MTENTEALPPLPTDPLRDALQRIVDWDAAGMALTEDHIAQARAALAQRQQAPGVEWLRRLHSDINTLAALSVKAERHAFGAALKLRVTEQIAALTAAPSAQAEPTGKRLEMHPKLQAFIDSISVHHGQPVYDCALMYDLRDLLNAAPPAAQAELRMSECPGCGMEFADGALHNANLELHRLRKAAQAEPQVPLTDERMHEILGMAGPDLLELAKLWADNKVHVYQFVNEAEKIVAEAVRRGVGKQDGK